MADMIDIYDVQKLTEYPRLRRQFYLNHDSKLSLSTSGKAANDAHCVQHKVWG